MKRFILLMFIMISLIGCSNATTKKKKDNMDIRATVITSQGPVELFLYPEVAPLAVANFINLSKRGFYNDLTFHRVIEKFMAQGGDPTGTGTGDAGYKFNDQFDWRLQFHSPGILAMANSGPNTNGSQFFITVAPQPHLNNYYTAFGEVASKSALERVTKIKKGDKIKTVIISGEHGWLLDKYADNIAEWNEKLDATGFVDKIYDARLIEDDLRTLEEENESKKQEKTKQILRNNK